MTVRRARKSVSAARNYSWPLAVNKWPWLCEAWGIVIVVWGTMGPVGSDNTRQAARRDPGSPDILPPPAWRDVVIPPRPRVQRSLPAQAVTPSER